MEEINKSVPPIKPSDAPATKPTSESTENSLDFELVSKKEKKFPFLWVIVLIILLSFITVGVLVYLKIIELPFNLF